VRKRLFEVVFRKYFCHWKASERKIGTGTKGSCFDTIFFENSARKEAHPSFDKRIGQKSFRQLGRGRKRPAPPPPPPLFPPPRLRPGKKGRKESTGEMTVF
jgi:hypothetical protein